MKLPLYQIDAFADKVFSGNPACIVPLNNWLPDDILLKIAKENAVAETAFFVDKGDNIHSRTERELIYENYFQDNSICIDFYNNY